jgi:hypothetical protein
VKDLLGDESLNISTTASHIHSPISSSPVSFTAFYFIKTPTHHHYSTKAHALNVMHRERIVVKYITVRSSHMEYIARKPNSNAAHGSARHFFSSSLSFVFFSFCSLLLVLGVVVVAGVVVAVGVVAIAVSVAPLPDVGVGVGVVVDGGATVFAGALAGGATLPIDTFFAHADIVSSMEHEH